MTAEDLTAEQRDRDRILSRLRNAYAKSGVCGFASHQDAELLRQMDREGLVECWLGDGLDRGIMLAKLRQAPSAGALAPTSQPGGAA